MNNVEMKGMGSESCSVAGLGSSVVDRAPGSTTTLSEHQNWVPRQDFPWLNPQLLFPF
jgi:hypothetical protein